MAFDEDYEDLGPGHLLSLMAIRRAFDAGYRELNFGGNYAHYKARWGEITPTRRPYRSTAWVASPG